MLPHKTEDDTKRTQAQRQCGRNNTVRSERWEFQQAFRLEILARKSFSLSMRRSLYMDSRSAMRRSRAKYPDMNVQATGIAALDRLYPRLVTVPADAAVTNSCRGSSSSDLLRQKKSRVFVHEPTGAQFVHLMKSAKHLRML